MKARNYHYYGTQSQVQRLAEEYAFLGREVVIEHGHLTVLALPKKKIKNDTRGKSGKSQRDNKSQDRDAGQNAGGGGRDREQLRSKPQRPKG